MTKAELAEKVKRKASFRMDSLQAEEFINIMTHEIIKATSNGDRVYIRGFGRFGSKIRAAKKAQNITRGETIDLPEHRIPHFKAYSNFKDKVE